jgi:hypothetical protein
MWGNASWEREKEFRFSFAGSSSGKRAWLIDAVQAELGRSFNNASGQWVQSFISTLNRSHAYLYLSHSNVQSFSTFRIWQAVCGLTAMVAEGGRDCWPMTEEMYIPIPTLTKESVPEVCRSLMEIPTSVFSEKARALHDGLRYMTTDHVIENYLVPASMEIAANRVRGG